MLARHRTLKEDFQIKKLKDDIQISRLSLVSTNYYKLSGVIEQCSLCKVKSSWTVTKRLSMSKERLIIATVTGKLEAERR